MNRCIVLIALVLLLFSETYGQQPISGTTLKLVASIAKTNRYESQFVGFAGTPSAQYKYYQDLKRTATKEELQLLLTHENPVIRVYSFKSLYEQDPIIAGKWGKKLQNDTASFMTLEGCIAGSAVVKTYVNKVLKK